MNVTKQYFRYVSQNIFGLIGTSCYILADTYFIAQAAGTDGVAMLNLCLPIYNFIFAFGSMIGLGSATRYAILKAQNDERAHRYFSNGLMCAILIAVPFMLVGAFCPDAVLRLMGGDAAIVALGLQYTRIFLLFTPFFMCNYIVSAFTRNDSAAPALPPLVQEAMEDIRANYAGLYGVEELSERLGVSKSHLVRMFTAALGIPPGRYLTKVRVEAAMRLLLHREYTLDVIASLCGFSGANYLCRVFKKETGHSPAQWRAMAGQSLRPSLSPEESQREQELYI